ARLTAALGKRVGIAEASRFGGTCVIRGCVPKKLFVYASQFPEHFRDAEGFGWTVPEARFDWLSLRAAKDKEISRLEGLYRGGIEVAGGDAFASRATLLDPHTIRLEAEDRSVTADQILIAVGGYPNPHVSLPGHEHCIVSDDAFDLPELPKRIVIAGGGYIAVEFANIFHGLGVETALVYRGKEILQHFDMDLRRTLHETMMRKGIRILCHTMFERVEKAADGTRHTLLSSGQTLVTDQVMLALGRLPNTQGLGLERAGVAVGHGGDIPVDEYSRTSVANIWAVGDVTNRIQLTPVAIHEGMCFVETAFKGNPTKPDHECVATAVFSQPELGTVGLTEDAAPQCFEDLEIYRALFTPLRNTLSGRDEKVLMKLVVDAKTRKVVGAHMLGTDAGEMAQLLGVAVKAGLSKDDFDRTMAIHPTAAEEFVTMYKPAYRLRNGEKIAP
ncbi:MAG: glutathione-disulfide reductase, partial [Methylobacterium mesophilicum]|nr:glutathione-disulfide reductase [Methylobacterium mesophilicum]